MRRGDGEMRASRHVAAPPEAVFAFLCDLRHHWQLERSLLQVEELSPAGERPGGATVRIRGPFGIGREARTTLLETRRPADGAPGRVRGRAELGEGTSAAVAWELEPDGGGTRVTLSAHVERATRLDRLLLALGGRRWLRHVFRRALEQLERLL